MFVPGDKRVLNGAVFQISKYRLLLKIRFSDGPFSTRSKMLEFLFGMPQFLFKCRMCEFILQMYSNF